MRLRSIVLPFLFLYSLSAIATLSDSVTRFSHNVGNRIFDSKQANLCVSGASIHQALAMAFMGTGQDSLTRREMAQVLRLRPKVDLSNLASNYAALIDDLKVSKMSQWEAEPPVLTMANRVVLFNGVEVEPSFLALTGKMGAQAQEFAKGTKTADILAKINGWVAEQTHQKIPTILSKLSADEFMVLLNAVYFKGEWTKQFSKFQTHDADFLQLDKTSKKVPMMSARQEHYRYLATEEAEILELPYAGAYTGEHRPRFSMFFVLPSANKNFAGAYADFDLNLLETVARSLPIAGNIAIPKSKVEAEMDLVTILKTMGMPSAFTYGEADFSGIAKGKLKIGQVIHKTFIDVNESGTEAAGATAVTISRECAFIPPASVFTFVADRPFFFFIRDNDQKMVLFEGVIASL